MYQVVFTSKAKKSLERIDKKQVIMIMAWISKNLIDTANPRKEGKALKGKYQSLWRYRIGNYRILASIEDQELLILLVEIGHRRKIY